MLPTERAATVEENFIQENILIRIEGKYVFKEGEMFDSYEDLLHRMDLHTKESLVYYWRRDSRTVERAFTKTTRPIASKLRYYLVRFACVYGGMKFQTRGAGRRVSQSMRTDCPAHILLRASKCGEKLEVISVCNDHNHEISEKASQLIPQNRRLPTALKEEVLEMLRLKIDKKKIIEYVRQRENKKITSKDLFNLASRLKSNDIGEEQDKRISVLQSILKHTTEKSIKSIVTSELSVYEPDPLGYYPVNTSEIVEYISPEQDFRINETIIESIVEARKREMKQMEESKETKPFEGICIKSEEIIKGTIDEIDISDDIIIDESEVLEQQDVGDQEHSPVVVYEDLIGQDECSYYYSTDQLNPNSVSYSEQSTVEESEQLSSNCSVILFETTTDNNIDETVVNEQYEENKLHEQNPTEDKPIAAKIKKSFNRVLKCRKCGTNSRLVKVQIDYLRARKAKLLAETSMLTLKKKKLKEEIRRLENIL